MLTNHCSPVLNVLFLFVAFRDFSMIHWDMVIFGFALYGCHWNSYICIFSPTWKFFGYYSNIFAQYSPLSQRHQLNVNWTFKICPIAPLDSVYFSFFPSLFFILDNFYILPSSLLILSKKIYFSGMFHLLLLILFLCWDSFFSFILVLFSFIWLIFDIIIVLKFLFAQIPKSPQE